MKGWQVAKIDGIPRAGKRWIPIRKHFDGRAFGVNAWVADDEGEDVIGEHTEEGTGHEELYLVVSGHATFTLDGEEVDAPAGTLVYLARTETKRKAVSREAGTTILSIGAKAGEAYDVQPWEVRGDVPAVPGGRLRGGGRAAACGDRARARSRHLLQPRVHGGPGRAHGCGVRSLDARH
jgi:hypothetical protein